jgi:signal transduction histidine kinase
LRLNFSQESLLELLAESINSQDFMLVHKEIKPHLMVYSRHAPFFASMLLDPIRVQQFSQNFLSNAVKFSQRRADLKVELELLRVGALILEEHVSVGHLWENPSPRKTSLKLASKPLGSLVAPEELVNTPALKELYQTDFHNCLVLVEYSVVFSDKGPGISKQGLDQLFQAQNSLQEHAHLNPHGNGFGLLNCKRAIVEGFGGRIEVFSEEGKGTEVQVTLQSVAKVASSCLDQLCLGSVGQMQNFLNRPEQEQQQHSKIEESMRQLQSR